MKTVFLTLVLLFSMFIGLAQEKTKKQIKEEKKIAKEKEIQSLVDSKEFEFRALRAFPQGSGSIDLTTNVGYLKFDKDSITSEMPFFGRAFSGVSYGGGNGGLYFKGKIQGYSLKKERKKHIIKANIRDQMDSYNLILTVFQEGTASLSVNSMNRSAISYNGTIEKLKKK